MTTLQEALDALAARRPKVIDLSLGRIRETLAALGDPQLTVPPIFHVAGTNGKGSTVAFLRAILETAGLTTHVYTSPHLVRFNERIVLAGAEASDERIMGALGAVDAAAGEGALTYFEAATCAAFLLYAQTPADALLLEVGLGGRYDATNVAPTAAAGVVAPVDLDHAEFLGRTIEAAAREKGGVFREGAPAVIGRQSTEGLEVLKECAAEVGARTHILGEDWDAYMERGRFVYQDGNGLLDLESPRLPGAHQIDNAGLAVAAIRASGFLKGADIPADALQHAKWPARLQRLTRGALIDLAAETLGAEPEIWLDGGHNPHAARALARAMADLDAKVPRPLVLITGMLANKDAHGYFSAFEGIASRVFTVSASRGAAATPQALAAAARQAGLAAETAPTLEAGLKTALQGNEAPRILICGSLYLAGEVLKENA